MPEQIFIATSQHPTGHEFTARVRQLYDRTELTTHQAQALNQNQQFWQELEQLLQRYRASS